MGLNHTSTNVELNLFNFFFSFLFASDPRVAKIFHIWVTGKNIFLENFDSSLKLC